MDDELDAPAELGATDETGSIYDDPIEMAEVSVALPRHRAIRRVAAKTGGDAPWLYLCSLLFTFEYETDGYISADDLELLALGVSRKRIETAVKALVYEGLWDRSRNRVERARGGYAFGYQIHHWKASRTRLLRERERRRREAHELEERVAAIEQRERELGLNGAGAAHLPGWAAPVIDAEVIEESD